MVAAIGINQQLQCYQMMGGFDNLFAGVGILAKAQQIACADGGDKCCPNHPTVMTGASDGDNGIGQGGAPHDKETGGARKGRVLLFCNAIDTVHSPRKSQLLRSSLIQPRHLGSPTPV
jgi:hypothetical protein